MKGNSSNLVSLRGTNIGEGLTFRNLIIPRVVKAIRNIDTKTGRSEQKSTRSKSITSDVIKRQLITVKKRLIPKDILTDAKSNSNEVHELLSDRSNTTSR